MPHLTAYYPCNLTGTCPNQTIFAKKSVAQWAEQLPGKRGLVGWIGINCS